jgi:hypothetical protein
MSNEKTGAALLIDHAPGRCYVRLKRSLRLLDDADIVAVLHQDIVSTFPAGAIGPGSVYQNNISNGGTFVLRVDYAAAPQQDSRYQKQPKEVHCGNLTRIRDVIKTERE